MRHPSGAPTLLLVPTELERNRLRDLGGFDPGLALLELCGFGPVAAAARTAHLLAVLRPARVVLVGIAGSYDPRAHPVGEALEFGAVAIDGIGVGEGRELLAPPVLGFPQWPGSSATCERAIFDRLPLAVPSENAHGLLLTTCAASADPEQSAVRRARFPHALAEDMEGFAVAAACALADVPLRIVRGLSNEVGDRRPENWRLPAALAAARRFATEILEGASPWSDGG